MNETRHSFKTVLSFIVHMISPFKVGIGVMLMTAVGWAINISLRPYILKIILNRIAEPTTQNLFNYLALPAAAYLGSSLFMSTIFRIYGYFVEIRMTPRLRKRIGTHALERLLEQSHQYYQDNFAGSLGNKVNDLVSGIPDILQITIDRFLCHGLAITVATYTLWNVNPTFGLFVMVWTTLFIGGSIIFSRRLVRLADAWSEYASIITGFVVDVLGNILSVRLFAKKKNEIKNMADNCDLAIAAEQKLQWAYFFMWLICGYSFALIQGLNLYLLIKGRQEGWITVGDFALVLTLNFSILESLWKMTQEFSQFSKIFGRITQALRNILVEPDLKDVPNATELVVTKGEITFENVQFNYKGTQAIFHNKSVNIPSGQKVGLVGYSGSGKSTFVNLILRLFDVSSGRILIDGQDIKQVTQDSLRSAIGMIPQDTSLFHRTLRENIAYGKTGATNEEIITASKRAFADEFIENLPLKYETEAGERGLKISGGQRQRIAIARAFLKNAPILMLDEATSQLDSLTEMKIQSSLDELMEGKTTLVIAHRLSTLLDMDRIIVFDKGHIVEDGTHHELFAKNGLYKQLWQAQVGGFLPERKE